MIPVDNYIYHDSENRRYYIFKTIFPVICLDTEVSQSIIDRTAELVYTGNSKPYTIKKEGHCVQYALASDTVFREWRRLQHLLTSFIIQMGIPEEFIRLETHPLWDDGTPVTVSESESEDTPVTAIQRAKPHLTRLVVTDAIKENKLCSITHDPITLDSVCIFPCYHCFSKDAIQTWLRLNRTCPECREVCG